MYIRRTYSRTSLPYHIIILFFLCPFLLFYCDCCCFLFIFLLILLGIGMHHEDDDGTHKAENESIFTTCYLYRSGILHG